MRIGKNKEKKKKRSWVLTVAVKTEEAKMRGLRSEMGKWQLRGVGESKKWRLFFFLSNFVSIFIPLFSPFQKEKFCVGLGGKYLGPT